MVDAPDGGIDPRREALLRALHDGSVQFVLIGGAALESHGERYETEDVDVTPECTQENLARLAEVLNRLECHLEVDPAHPERAVPLPGDYFTATVLARATVWNLGTLHGKLDLSLSPSGFPEGYSQLAIGARRARVAATTIEVSIASLAEVEHSKRRRPLQGPGIPRTGRTARRAPRYEQPVSERAVDRGQPAARLRAPRRAAHRQSLDRRSTANATRPRAHPRAQPQPQSDR